MFVIPYIILIAGAIFIGLTIVSPYLGQILAWLLKTYTNVSTAKWLDRNGTPLPPLTDKELLSTFRRILVANWYTFLLMLLLSILMIFTIIEKDIITIYISEVDAAGGFLPRFVLYMVLFVTVFVLSFSIWIMPIFLYSIQKIRAVLLNPKRFYLETKLLSFVAMLPFVIVGNAAFFYNFFERFAKDDTIETKYVLVFNLGLLVMFAIISKLGNLLPSIRFFNSTNNKYGIYLFTLKAIFVLVILLAAAFSVPSLSFRGHGIAVTIFLFLSSAIVFKRMVNTPQDPLPVRIHFKVISMIGKENRKHSRNIYVTIFGFVIVSVLSFHFSYSLEAVSALVILLVLFSFNILYLDFWRNIYRNGNNWWRIAAFCAVLLFFALPFLPYRQQFTIPLTDYPSSSPAKISLEAALKLRCETIDSAGKGPYYIVCAMGGGSRAGYITSTVLKKLEESYKGFTKSTVCYSTISGSSVGAYAFMQHMEYLKGKDSSLFRTIFEGNYNSSGTYGLLFGDALETLFAPAIVSLRAFVANDTTSTGFFDRNHRIRAEYNRAVRKVFKVAGIDAPETELFQAYFNKKKGTIPIHLINSFEVNNGRRTVLSPFPPANSLFFPNAITPLSDMAFGSNIARKDITYREATNLSELFPLVSAASHIGFESHLQFVDGGYYENYGLPAALDVRSFMIDKLGIDKDSIRIILIKNSLQEPDLKDRGQQLFAPVRGALSSPFTGHANHFSSYARRDLGNNYLEISFDSKTAKVPLTRSLTSIHLDSMDDYVLKRMITDEVKRFFNR